MAGMKLMLVGLAALLFAACGTEGPTTDHTEQLVGQWTEAKNEPSPYPGDVHSVVFERTGDYASTWKLADGSVETTRGAWTAQLGGVQVATNENGTVVIVTGQETQAIDYIVDGLDTPNPRLWLGSALFVR